MGATGQTFCSCEVWAFFAKHHSKHDLAHVICYCSLLVKAHFAVYLHNHRLHWVDKSLCICVFSYISISSDFHQKTYESIQNVLLVDFHVQSSIKE